MNISKLKSNKSGEVSNHETNSYQFRKNGMIRAYAANTD